MGSMPYISGNVEQPAQGGRFDFTSAYLKQKHMVFTRTPDREPVLKVDFGGNSAAVPLAMVDSAAELSAGHPDLSLLRIVAPALNYCETIAAGDPIPSELIDGRPSWRVAEGTLERVEQRILEALSARSAGDGTTEAANVSEIIARELIGIDTRRKSHIVDQIRDHLDSAARSVRLREDVTRCQRMVGEMATLGTQREAFAEQDRLRDAALKLRSVMVWATKRTMGLDMLANDIRGAIADQERLGARVWPAINELRAWSLDIAPVRRAWRGTSRICVSAISRTFTVSSPSASATSIRRSTDRRLLENRPSASAKATARIGTMAVDQQDDPIEERPVREAETEAAETAAQPAQPSSQQELALGDISTYPTLESCLMAWNAARIGDKLPASLDVGTVPEAVLDYTMLLDYLPAEEDAVVRMVGNYIGEKAAFQAFGMTVRAFFEERDALIVTDALRRIAESRSASLARRSFVPIAGAPMSYVRLILPLPANGDTVTGFFKTIEPSSLTEDLGD